MSENNRIQVVGFSPPVAAEILDNLDASKRKTPRAQQSLQAVGILIVQTTAACLARTDFNDPLPIGTAKSVHINATRNLVVGTQDIEYLNLGVGTVSDIAANTILILTREEISNWLLANWEAC